MTEQHPITPPEELVDQWSREWFAAKVKHYRQEHFIAIEAARWGAQKMALYLSDQWADRVQADLENGVRYLNSKAVAEFQRRYPNVSGFESVIRPYLPEDY